MADAPEETGQERFIAPPSGISLEAMFDELPKMDTYEIQPEAPGKKVIKKKGRRYIENAYEIVSARDGAKCRRCDKTEHLTLDHIVPVWLISQLTGLMRSQCYDDTENLEILCRRCNLFKGGRLDFLNPKTKPLLLKYFDLV